MKFPLVARTPSDADGPWLGEVLRRAKLMGNAHEIHLASYARVGNGMMSDTFRFSLEHRDRAASVTTLVGKFAAANATSRSTAVKLGLYATEINFYRHLAHTVDVRTPKIWYAEIDEATHDFTLIMEDQAPARAVDQLHGCSLEDCESALRELARLHGPRWNDPALARIAWFRDRLTLVRELVDTGFADMVAGFLDRYGSLINKDCVPVIDRFSKAWPLVLRDTRSPRTIAHTDFRPDNLLFDVHGERGSVVVLDWAGILNTSGLLDVAYFIGSALTSEQRRSHERDLVKVYFSELSKYPLAGYDFDACWLDYRRFPFFGLYTGVSAALMVERSERSDALFVQMVHKFCDQVLTLDSLPLWE